jgi:transcriptional regulator with XRE-family HTH domain
MTNNITDSEMSSPEFQQAFGARLKAARISAGYDSAADMAKALQFNVGRWEGYESGTESPSYELLIEFSKLTGASLEALVTGTA